MYDDEQQQLLNSGDSASRAVSPRACVLCALGLLVFACIVGAIVVPVVLLLADSPSLAPPGLACAPDARRLLSPVDDVAFARLTNLTDNFGHRLVGSATLREAAEWAAAEMRRDGLTNVQLQNVTVDVWQRPKESLVLLGEGTRPDRNMEILALGGSVNGSVSAELLCVESAAELRSLAAAVRGRAVLFNNKFTTYAESVEYRARGAPIVAALGGVAMLVRSVTPRSLYTPHTGATSYGSLPASQRIPAVAVTTEDADLLARLQAAGRVLRIRLELVGPTDGGAGLSFNVMGEVRGRELPDEVVVVGGHIDSWDVGQGALDDATGFVAAWSAVARLAALAPPRRTVRAVGFTGEERGAAGAAAYAARHGRGTYFALESDGGTNGVRGLALRAPPAWHARVGAIAGLLALLGTDALANASDVGADIAPLVRAGAPGAALEADAASYFWVHHTRADTLDKVSEPDFARAVATLAVYAYCVAESDLPPANLTFGGL